MNRDHHARLVSSINSINYANEYEPDVLNTHCATRAWKLNILQRMYDLISTFATQRFCCS